jgi:hypothetical protein
LGSKYKDKARQAEKEETIGRGGSSKKERQGKDTKGKRRRKTLTTSTVYGVRIILKGKEA